MPELEKSNRGEFDTIVIYNPLEEPFQARFNGELYRIGAEETKSFPAFLGFHMAKELSDNLLQPDLRKLKADADKSKNPNPFNPRNAQLMVYDNPRRRITLYQVLRDKGLVQECIQSFPFKAFIGEMSEYDSYVEKATEKKSPKTAKSEGSDAKTEE